MTFEVKYRNKQGATDYMRVDAESRSGVFAILKERGISAIQVTEAKGKAKPRKATNTGAPMSGAVKGLAALVVVCIIGAVAYLIVSQDAPKPAVEEKEVEKKAIEEVVPEIVNEEVVETPKDVPPVVVTNYNAKGVWYDDKGRPHYKPARVVYMGSNTVINGKAWTPPRRLFSHPSELELDRVLSAKPGERIIGETNWRLFARDLQDALIDPIRFDEEDTAEEIQRKKDVIQAKKELAGMIGDGVDPCEVLRQAQDDLNKLANLYDDLNKTLYEARTSGELTEEEIDDYVAAANKMLESKGIFARKFYTPSEIREKAEAAKMRRYLNQMGQ